MGSTRRIFHNLIESANATLSDHLQPFMVSIASQLPGVGVESNDEFPVGWPDMTLAAVLRPLLGLPPLLRCCRDAIAPLAMLGSTSPRVTCISLNLVRKLVCLTTELEAPSCTFSEVARFDSISYFSAAARRSI